MRIIGGRDYYDGAAAYGVDPGIVFVREPFHLTNAQMDRLGRYRTGDFFLYPKGEELTLKSQYEFRMGNMAPGLKVKVTNPILIFCGKVYSGIFVTLIRGHGLGEVREEYYFWNAEKFETFLDEHGWELKAYLGYHERRATVLESTFAVTDLTGDALTFVLENQIVSVVPVTESNMGWRPRSSWSSSGSEEESGFEANGDTLKDWHFQKALDPVTAFQEISQWVGGTLANHGPQTIEITDDKVKAHKAGFDKWSFRNKTENSK